MIIKVYIQLFEYFATILIIIGVLYQSKPKIICWWFMNLGQLIWIVGSWYQCNMPLFVQSVLFFIINTIAHMVWYRKGIGK